jgi:hypothetical protein
LNYSASSVDEDDSNTDHDYDTDASQSDSDSQSQSSDFEPTVHESYDAQVKAVDVEFDFEAILEDCEMML